MQARSRCDVTSCFFFGRWNMTTLPVFDRTGAEVGSYEIDPAVLAPRINKQLLHDVVVMYQANQRQGSAKTKSRARSPGRRRRCIGKRGRAMPGPVRGGRIFVAAVATRLPSGPEISGIACPARRCGRRRGWRLPRRSWISRWW